MHHWPSAYRDVLERLMFVLYLIVVLLTLMFFGTSNFVERDLHIAHDWAFEKGETNPPNTWLVRYIDQHYLSVRWHSGVVGDI